MKTLIKITIILLFITQNLVAQYNLSPDAPVNPVPVKFHKDHFFIKGDIKERRDKKGNYVLFNKKGYLLKSVSNEGFTKKTFYYEDDKLIKITGYFVDHISLDNKNRPVLMKGKKGDITKKYEYDSHGNFIKEYESYWGKLYLKYKYKYDNQNRLIEKQELSSGGKLLSTSKYNYQKDGDYLKIIRTDEGFGQKTSTIMYFKNGISCGSGKYPPKLDKHHNPKTIYESNYSIPHYVTYTYYQKNENDLSNDNCTYGDCINGWGIKKYQDGKYSGFFINGLRDGAGKYKWNNGDEYVGEWKKDVREGFGFFTDSKKQNRNYGEYANGKLNGLGVVKSNGIWKQGVFKDNKLITEYDFIKTGNKTGCVAGNCNNKYGRYIYDNGDKFTGFFKNSTPYLGEYVYVNEDMYWGYSHQNPNTYYNEFFYKNGDIYRGNWKNGKKNGRGFYYNKKDNTARKGIWKDDKLIKSL